MEQDQVTSPSQKAIDPELFGGPIPLEARPKSAFLGQILVEEGLLGPDALRRLIQRQCELGPEERLPIGLLAVEDGLLDEAQLMAMLDSHGWRLHLGELLVMRGHLTLQDLIGGMQEQDRTGELLGQVLLRLGLCDEGELAEGLAEQCGVAYVRISQIPPNPELAHWVNASFARTHALVPIVRRGRSLTVAVWEPRSLSVVADIEQATGLGVNVVLTTRQEVEQRIRELYLPAPVNPEPK